MHEEAEPYPYILNITDGEFASLGRLVVVCAHLELLLFVRARRGLDKDAAAKVAVQPVSEAIKILRASLSTVTEPEARALLEAAADALDDLFTQRNALVHGAWLNDADNGRPIAVNPRRGRVPKYGDEAATSLTIAIKATNDLLRGTMIEAGIRDFPLPTEFRFSPPG